MPPKTQSLFLFSAPIDFFFMGGVSFLLLPVFYFFSSPSFNSTAQECAIVLLWFANWPHFASTLSRLYRSQERVQEYPWTAIALPLTIIALAGFALNQPTSIGTLLVKTYTLWAPYHFCGQSLGVALLYCRRAGVSLTQWQRRFFGFFVFSPMWVLIARGESFPWEQHLSGITFRSLETPKVLIPISIAFFVLSAIAFFASLRLRKTILPLIAFVPVLSQIAWFILAPYLPSYNEFVPFFHSIQYLPIVFLFERKSANAGGSTLGWYRQNFLVGAVLFWALPLLLTPFGFAYGVAKGVVFATINLHHFIVDGVIWKLRDKRVALRLEVAPAG